MKKLDKWVPHELTGNKKSLFWSIIFSYFVQQERIVSWSEYDEWWKLDFIQQSGMTSSVVWLRSSSKALAKTKLVPKKGRGHCLVIWSTTASWIPVIHLHMRSMCRKPMKCTENCNACSQHSSTERAQSLSPSVPDHTSHSQCFKSLTNWATKVCFICHIHLASYQLTTTSFKHLNIFCRENASTISRRQKMLSKGLLNSKTQTFMLQELANLVVLAVGLSYIAFIMLRYVPENY